MSSAHAIYRHGTRKKLQNRALGPKSLGAFEGRDISSQYADRVGLATVHDIGYALCEIAENPRHTSNNGVSRLAQTVRQWRIAAGLTQTAVAKQSGVNRSYLSHLESGRRNPTLATLQRLAKILNVAPGYFL